jgi:hypothetical protein
MLYRQFGKDGDYRDELSRILRTADLAVS